MARLRLSRRVFLSWLAGLAAIGTVGATEAPTKVRGGWILRADDR